MGSDPQRGSLRLAAAAAGLGVLLVMMAIVQYRWLGDVSAAERGRMRENLHTRVVDFAQAFDGDLTTLYAAFQVDPVQFDSDPAKTLATAFSEWQRAAPSPSIVRAVDVVDQAASGTGSLQRFDPSQSTLRPIPWPPELQEWRVKWDRTTPSPDSIPFVLADVVDGSIPALVVPVPHMVRNGDTRGHVTVMSASLPLGRAILIELDETQLRDGLVEPLVARYFGKSAASDYAVTIVRREDPSRVVFSSDPAMILDQKSADVTAGLFGLKMDEPGRVALAFKHEGAPRANFSFTIVRRGAVTEEGNRRMFVSSAASQEGWQLLARYRSDSLDAIVTKSRRRNFAIVVIVLGLLAGSVMLVFASADRQRRLARQQLEFVAAVSHELRTPLAVICSAGENLADGLVTDGSQVRRYGAMMATEGRRLADMVERVMRFAGFAVGARIRPDRAVDLVSLVEGAIASAKVAAGDRDVRIDFRHESALTLMRGDADALRSAFQNVLSNAIKYSSDGRTIDIRIAADGGRARVEVADRGIGIHDRDLPHVFEPFYRGRNAVEAQIRGSGIGLSIVRTIVVEHGGDVRIARNADGGTTVTIDLPIREPSGSVEEAYV